MSLGILTDPNKDVYTNGYEWEKQFKEAKVHIQWDSERTIQVGISRFLIEEYNNGWIDEIVDLTPLVKKMYLLRKSEKYKEVKRLLPKERIYLLNKEIEKRIAIN